MKRQQQYLAVSGDHRELGRQHARCSDDCGQSPRGARDGERDSAAIENRWRRPPGDCRQSLGEPRVPEFAAAAYERAVKLYAGDCRQSENGQADQGTDCRQSKSGRGHMFGIAGNHSVVMTICLGLPAIIRWAGRAFSRDRESQLRVRHRTRPAPSSPASPLNARRSPASAFPRRRRPRRPPDAAPAGAPVVLGTRLRQQVRCLGGGSAQ